MKWYRFEDKLPELGTNVVIATEHKLIGMLEFDLAARKTITSIGSCDYHEQEYVSDDASEIHVYDLICSKYWAYPSSIRLPKEKNEKENN
jgi:hypothetical protein